ncbi:MAG: ABC transporter permease [Planctomycetota bacterium]
MKRHVLQIRTAGRGLLAAGFGLLAVVFVGHVVCQAIGLAVPRWIDLTWAKAACYALGIVGLASTLWASRHVEGEPDLLTRLLASAAGRATLALVLVFLLGVVFDADGTFFKPGAHARGIREFCVHGILACGMTLVIISAGIDLSVGSVLALVAVSLSLMRMSWGWPWWAAVPACLAIGTACGAVSGTLTARLKIQPFVATLAMMVFARGLARWLCDEEKVQPDLVQGPDGKPYLDVPEVFQFVSSWVPGGVISVVTVVFLICAAATWLALARHRWGRELYAIGGNEEAARLSGMEEQGNSATGATYELTAIAMVVIGGTSLMGGRGGIGLTVLGVFTIGYLGKILSINDVSNPVEAMLTGIVIVGAVLTQRRRH